MSNTIKEVLKHKSIRRSLYAGFVAAFAVATISAVNPSANAANRNEFPTQKQFECFEAAKSRAFTEVKEVGGQIHGRILVPKDCDHLRVTLVVYKLLDGNWEHKNANQVIFDTAGGREFNSGTHTLIVNKPNCGYQADLIYGFQAVQHPNPQIQKPVYDSLVGGNGVPCAQTPTPPVDVCPNIEGHQDAVPTGMEKDANGNCVNPVTPTDDDGDITNTNTNSNANTVSVGSGSGSFKKADELPNTGPGAVVATFAGVSTISSLLYSVVARRFGA